jgi:hypothetical protein
VYWGKNATDKIEIGASGLLAEFFSFTQYNSIPSLTGRSADITRTDSEVNYAATNNYWPGMTFRDHFAARWSGHIKLSIEGTYVFFLKSDDGSRLFINGERS